AAPKSIPSSNVANYANGKIPSDQLVAIPGGMLEANAAAAYNRMLADAQAQGIPLGVTDSYRSYAQQVDLVNRKGLYSQGGLGAAPGTSEHGWGQAVDVKGGPQVLAWLQANASKYGFVANTPREPWHYGYEGPGSVKASHTTPVTTLKGGETSGAVQNQVVADVHGDGFVSGDPKEDAIRGALGWMGAFLDMPVVGDILRQSVGDPLDPTDDWTPERLQAALQGTDWWKTTQESARLFDAKMINDPATQNSEIQSEMAKIQDRANQGGYSINPGHLHDLAVTALRLNMSDLQIDHAIGAESLREGSLGTSTTHQTVRQTASSYGVPLSNDAVDNWTNQIATGAATTEDLRQILVAQAKGLYPAFSDGLDRGLTVNTLASPYIQNAVDNLGIDANSISFADPKWNGALTGIDPKTGAKNVLSLDQFQQKIRSDPNFGWQNTAGARAQTYAFAAQLGKAFGTYQGTPA
ncbi:MAG TPA: M15 family metallopeptidase, partial [Acidimicrobiales bacterium]